MKTKHVLTVLCLLSVFSVSAMADSIDPAVFNATLGLGESVTVRKTVNVMEGAGTGKVDVFFLADTTGSMGSQINAVKAAAASILATAGILGDVAFGVGEYKDITDAYSYRLNTAMTTNQVTAQAGINLYGATGGGDRLEAQLFALEEVASQPATGWRAGSERILVWFGDEPGHDPRLGSTEASATAALIAQNIQVQALDVRRLDESGQATRIANATGGTYQAGVNTANIVATITAAIAAAVDSYTLVDLDISEVPVGVSASYTPAAGHVGVWDRSIARSFDFDLTFTGDAIGTFWFNVYGTVDGGRIAREEDHITVVPVPSSVLLLGVGMLTASWRLKRGKKNIMKG